MGLKAGWVALFIFVWAVGAFLGSTFDYQSSATAQGQTYSEGTATFTTGNATITGAGTDWVAGMADGNITATIDGVPCKILSIDAVNQLTLYAPYPSTGGAGLDYTMTPTPGWAGSGGGGYSDSPIATLQNLLYANQVEQRNVLIGTFTMLVNPKFWGAMYKIITWQWSFLYNTDGTMAYGLFYWIFLFPFVAMGLLCILLLVYGILTGNISW